MAKYDPRFWEIPVAPEVLDSFPSAEDVFEDIASGDSEKEANRREAVNLIKMIIASHLTPKQQQIVDLYFYKGLSQGEIAAQLGINQQVVSKHLFGVLREGKKIGGALQKLKKLCCQEGLDPSTWTNR